MTASDIIQIAYTVALCGVGLGILLWIFDVPESDDDLPHSYSTAQRHPGASGETRHSGVGKCATFGEGA